MVVVVICAACCGLVRLRVLLVCLCDFWLFRFVGVHSFWVIGVSGCLSYFLWVLVYCLGGVAVCYFRFVWVTAGWVWIFLALVVMICG